MNRPFLLRFCIPLIGALALVPYTDLKGQQRADHAAPRSAPADDSSAAAPGTIHAVPSGGSWRRQLKTDGSGGTLSYTFSIGKGSRPASSPSGPSHGGMSTATRSKGEDPAGSPHSVLLGATHAQAGIRRSSAVTDPPPGGLVSRRFVLDSDPKSMPQENAESWYEFRYEPGMVLTPSAQALKPAGHSGWVRSSR